MTNAVLPRGTFEAEEPLVALARAASTDTVAASAFVRAVAPKVTATVRALLGIAHPDVDDAVQQALIGLVRALPAYRGECDPVGYARVIATRTAIAMRTRERALRAHRDQDADPDSFAEISASPGETATCRERKELLRDLLVELPSEQAEAMALRVVLGLSLEEVACQMGVSANTVRSRLRLAKERLRARIEADPMLLEALAL